MAAKNIQELYDEARVIYTASTEGENTQVRIGQMFYDLIEHLYEISDVNGTVGPITPTPTPSTLGGPLLTSFNNMPIPTDPDQILHWIDSEDKWEFIDTPTGGGSGGSGDVTWLDLKTDNGSADDNKQINLSHLKNALSGYLENNLTGNNSLYSWWGQKLQKNTNTTPATYRITNAPLEGVTYIRFTNDVILGVDPSSAENTLCVYNSDLTKVGHIYATGGVSALGNSSSGGGSPTPGTPVDLRGLLSHISSSSYSPDYANTTAVSNALLALPDNGAGATIRWNGSKWIVDKTIFDDIANITDNGGSFLKKEDDGYSWSDPATGTSGSTTLSGLQDTTIGSLAPGQLLYYQDATDEWVNKTFAINSTASISNPIALQNIVFGGTKYTLPVADGSTAGIVAAGTGLSASSGTMSLTAATTGTLGGIRIGYTENDKNYPVKLSNNQAYVNVPWTDTDSTYKLILNGTTNGASDGTSLGTLYAPTGAGTTDYVLKSSGSGAPTWTSQESLSVGSLTTQNKRIWGNQYWEDGKPIDVTSDFITFGKSTDTAFTSAIRRQGTRNGNAANALIIGTSNTQSNLFEGFRTVPAQIFGSEIRFYGSTGNDNALNIYNDGNIRTSTTHCSVNIAKATSADGGLRIGDAILYWDGNNDSLVVCKYNGTSNPGVANFYATGGVSALGMSSGTSSIDAMTFGNVTVNNILTSTKLVLNTSSNAVLLNILSGKIQVSSNGGMVEALIKGGSTITLGDATNNECEIYMYDSNGDKYSFNIDAAINAGILVEA